MNSPLNTYILRLADVYLTYAEACLGNNSTLSDGRGLYFFNRVRERAKINKKSSITLDDIIRERRVEFGMEYSNWYDMVTWFRYLPDKMLNYFNNQWRGYRAEAIIKEDDAKLHFGKYETDGTTFLEGPEYYTAPEFTINIEAEDIFLPYPESDVIQNPLLNEPPVPYTFNE